MSTIGGESRNATLTTFRGEVRASPRLHIKEVLLLACISIQLCFLPWALGTMHVWSQFVSLGLSFLALTLALITRNYSGETTNIGSFRLVMWPKLKRFPLFWLGMLLMIYITSQALNPSWAYRTNGIVWWMQPITHYQFLPTGMQTSFKDMNAWRMLTIYSSVWLLVCAIWIGITRKRSIAILMAIIALNGALFSIIGMMQKVTGEGRIMWFYFPPTNSTFFASMIYKNHAGAYLNLSLVACVSCLLLIYVKKRRHHTRGSLTPIFVLGALVICMGISTTGSRASLLLMIGYVITVMIIFVRASQRDLGGRPIKPLLILVSLIVAAILFSIQFLSLETSLRNVLNLGTKDRILSIDLRSQAARATFEMATDKPFTGWGAGSFRHYFPLYQQNYPLLRELAGKPIRWEYAHNDILQLFAEVGLVGCAILLSCVGWWAKRIFRSAGTNVAVFAIFAGNCMAIVHGCIDFIFYCPAILATWFTLVPLSVKLMEIDGDVSKEHTN